VARNFAPVLEGSLLKATVTARDEVPSFQELSPMKPDLVGVVAGLQELGYTSKTFLLGSTVHISRSSQALPLLVLPCPLELL
jgi:hypothetical protein